MTDKEKNSATAMSDNEIIKALECCNSEKESLCFECPYHLCSPACLTRRNTDIIDLINRQKAEIEKLKEASEEAVSCFHRMESLYNIKCMELKVAKAEAVKECLEWVLSLFPEDKNFTTISRFTVNRKLKEMVGDTE